MAGAGHRLQHHPTQLGCTPSHHAAGGGHCWQRGGASTLQRTYLGPSIRLARHVDATASYCGGRLENAMGRHSSPRREPVHDGGCQRLHCHRRGPFNQPVGSARLPLEYGSGGGTFLHVGRNGPHHGVVYFLERQRAPSTEGSHRR